MVDIERYFARTRHRAPEGRQGPRAGGAAADEWLARMRADGIADVELVTNAEPEHAGRWTFTFRHRSQ